MARYLSVLALSLAGLLAAAFPLSEATAHDARPVSVLIRELPDDRLALRVRAPGTVAADNMPRLLAPESCQRVSLDEAGPRGARLQSIVTCPEGVQGRSFTLEYPIYNPSLSTFFRFEPLNAPALSALLPPDQASWTVPEAPSRFEVMRDYFWLGLGHIIGGLDHLLFITGLLIVAGTMRRSLIALTGFTLAHSVTLALSTLDMVRLAAPPVEAVIALSILFLAMEIVRNRKDSLTFRYPVLVASLFGLLHGFGFAGVLREIGVPQSEIGTALLSFNIGVEAGQVLFVVLMLAAFTWGKRVLTALPILGTASPERTIQLASAYAMGSIGFMWMLERVQGFA